MKIAGDLRIVRSASTPFPRFMPTPRPTLKEIARRAGLAISTVSLALRDDPSISAQTRAKVQDIAVRIGYRPNPLVSALMAQLHARRPTLAASVIAFIHGWAPEEQSVANSFWHYFLLYEEGARQRADALGFALERFSYNDPEMNEPRMARILLARNVAGILVAPMAKNKSCLDLPWEHFAFAAIGETLHTPPLHRTVTNHFAGMQIALSHLRAAGYERPGFVVTRHLNDRLNHHWMGAYCAYHASLPASRRVRPLLVEDHAPAPFARWFRREKPDAVIASDTPFRRHLEALARVPEEVAYVELGLDALKPPAAGIDQEPRLVGAAAIDMIVAQLHRNERGIPDRAKTMEVGGVWIPGPTVREPKNPGLPPPAGGAATPRALAPPA